MKKYFSDHDIKKIEASIVRFEELTGRELLIIATKNCDPYPGAILRFAFISMVLTLLCISLFGHEFSAPWWLGAIVIFFLFYTYLGSFSIFKKLALSEMEINRECREKSIEYFYQYAASHIANGSTIMILLSELEAHLEILVDESLKDAINEEVRNSMITFFKEQKKKLSLPLALDALIAHLELTIKVRIPGTNTVRSLDQLANTIYFLPTV